MRRAQAGDTDAFDVLYRRHRDSVFRICRNWLRDEHLAEDATQETFLKAWRSLSTVDADREFSHWLRRVARNHCHDVHAGHRVISLVELPPSDQADRAAEEAVTACVERLALQSAINRLGERDATLLVQRHIWEVPVKALAARWHITKSSMEMALHRARTRARRHARSEGLAALLPLGLARRVFSWVQRAGGEMAGMSGVASATAYQMAIAVAVVVAQPAAPLPGQPLAPAQIVVVDSEERVSVPVADKVLLTTNHATGVTGAARQGDGKREGGSADGSSTRNGQRPPVEFDGVEVPVTGSRVHQSPSGRPRQSFGARVGAGSEEHDASLESYDDDGDELRPVERAACDLASAGDPLTYCKRRKR